MITKKIFLSLLLFTLKLFSQNNVSVFYQVYPLNGTFENSEIMKNSPMRERFKGVDEALKKIVYELRVSDTISTFCIQQTLDFSIRENRLAKATSGGTDYFTYKNHVFYFSDLMDENFKVKVKNLDWKITNETQLISGYECYKAVAIKNNPQKKINKTFEIIAWFCPSIPISFGPKESCGLPGLILQYQDDKVVFLANKIDFKSESKIQLKFNKKKYIEIWEDDYNIMVREKTLKYYEDKNK